jgi:hypothetical protein
MDHYAHSLVEDERTALALLPDFQRAPGAQEEAVTGTEGPAGLVHSLVQQTRIRCDCMRRGGTRVRIRCE